MKSKAEGPEWYSKSFQHDTIVEFWENADFVWAKPLHSSEATGRSAVVAQRIPLCNQKEEKRHKDRGT